MTIMLRKMIAERINQLEENYHFNLNEYSFIYDGRKNFIIDITKRVKIIFPYLNKRKQLENFIGDNIEGDKYKFVDPKEAIKFYDICIEIFANTFDETKIGSVEFYLDHIWKSYDEAINNTTSVEPLQNFTNLICDIITMIDYSFEHQLSKLGKDGVKGLIAQSLVSSVNPDLEVVGLYEVTPNGKVTKVNYSKLDEQSDNEKEKIDLRFIKPINTKEI